MLRVQPDRAEIEIEPAHLRVEAVQIDDHDDYNGQIVGCFAKANQRWIISVVEAQFIIAL